VTIAGLVVAIRTMNSKRGDRIAFVTLDDRSGRIDLGVFAEAYGRYRDLIAKDRLLVVVGTVSPDEYSGGLRMSADKIYDIDQARERYARRLEIDLQGQAMGRTFSRTLQETLLPFREGDCPIRINYSNGQASASMALGPVWCVHPTDELLHRLGEISGSEGVRVVYE